MNRSLAVAAVTVVLELDEVVVSLDTRECRATRGSL